MDQQSEVVVTNIKMPFFSMVVFMIKWAIASIPAIIILSFILAICGLIFSSFMGGMQHMGRSF